MKTITMTDTKTNTTTTQECYNYMSTADVKAWFDAHADGDAEKVYMVLLNDLQIVTLTKTNNKLKMNYGKGVCAIELVEEVIEIFLGVDTY